MVMCSSKQKQKW